MAHNEPVPEGERHSIVIQSDQDVKSLVVCLLLKELIDLNADTGLGLSELKVGRTLLLPTERLEAGKFHVLDSRVAEYFYRIRFYYAEFEEAFARELREIEEKIAN